MKGVQCYELFGGITLLNHAFFFKYVMIEQVIIMNLFGHRYIQRIIKPRNLLVEDICDVCVYSR